MISIRKPLRRLQKKLSGATRASTVGASPFRCKPTPDLLHSLTITLSAARCAKLLERQVWSRLSVKVGKDRIWLETRYQNSHGRWFSRSGERLLSYRQR